MKKTVFGQMPDGTAVDLYTLTNAAGMRVGILTLGGVIATLEVPDRDGRFDNVVIGLDSVTGYLTRSSYFGALVGRYANRIAGGKFVLDGTPYQLACNNGPNALHGGLKGFDKLVWRATPSIQGGVSRLQLDHVSPDGDEGYPGTLSVTVVYTVTQDALRIDYAARTDRPTILNLTNHSYFNLAGEGTGDVMRHEVMIAADQFTPVDATLIPTGEIRAVRGTPFDFTEPKAIGADICRGSDEQILRGRGYDHNFVLRGPSGGEPRLAARVRDPDSGRVLEVLTTEPGVQFYTGNFLDGTVVGRSGATYRQSAAFCLETQKFPDTPNQPAFPSAVLRPDTPFASTTLFRFSTDRA
jgi:aldose 1-epimerase